MGDHKMKCTQCEEQMSFRRSMGSQTLFVCPNSHIYMTVDDRPWHYEGNESPPGVYHLQLVEEKEE